MIYIANPIYDAVFKFMMEDEAVAKRFIGIIINKKITRIKLKPQEKAYQTERTGIVIQRLDFVAEIREENGEKSKVLIEIQKSNKSYHADVLRFRGYLAQQYQSDDLPIITIYILGFELKDLDAPVTYINREYKDIYHNKIIEKKSEFIEKLTHNSYVIQVPKLKLTIKSKLTQLLELFNQEYKVSKDKTGSRVLSLPYTPDDKDVKLVLKRLEKANADEALREKLNDEEFADMAYEEMYGKLDKKVLRLEKRVEMTKQKLEGTKQELEKEKQKAEEEKKRAEEEKKRAEEEKKRAEEEKKRAEEEKKRAEEEKIETVKFLLSMNMSLENVMKATKTDIAFLKKHNLIK